MTLSCAVKGILPLVVILAQRDIWDLWHDSVLAHAVDDAKAPALGQHGVQSMQ